VRGNRIKQITRDQSLAQFLIESGVIEPDQASSIPQNVIIQALGTSPTVEVDITTLQLCSDDRLIICSDGLSNKVGPEELREIASQNDDLAFACRRFVEMANERGGEDNITVIVARFDGQSLHSAGDRNAITGSIQVVKLGRLNAEYSDAENEDPEPAEQHITTMVMTAVPAESAPMAESPAPAGSPSPESEDAISPDTPPHITQPRKPGLAIALLIAAGLLVAAYLFYLLASTPRR